MSEGASSDPLSRLRTVSSSTSSTASASAWAHGRPGSTYRPDGAFGQHATHPHSAEQPINAPPSSNQLHSHHSPFAGAPLAVDERLDNAKSAKDSGAPPEPNRQAEIDGLTPDYIKIDDAVDGLGGDNACARGVVRSLCFIRYWAWPSTEEFPYMPETPRNILQKMAGKHWFGPVPHRNAATISWTFLCVFITVATIGLVHEYALNPDAFPILFGSIGATVSIIYTNPGLEYTQPYNMIVGHIVPPFVAVSTWKVFSFDSVTPWLPAALSAGTSVAVMEALHGQNPPGGALSLIYIVTPQVRTLGYAYIGAAMLGICFVIAIAWVLNNAVRWMHWPDYWLPKLWLLQARAKAQVAEQMRTKSTQLEH